MENQQKDGTEAGRNTVKILNLKPGSLLNRVYKCPKEIQGQERLALRLEQLHELSSEMEESINSDVPRDVLQIYPWAIKTIASEIKVILDRLERRHGWG